MAIDGPGSHIWLKELSAKKVPIQSVDLMPSAPAWNVTAARSGENQHTNMETVPSGRLQKQIRGCMSRFAGSVNGDMKLK